MPFTVFFLAYATTLALANIHLWQKVKEFCRLSKIIAGLVYLIIGVVIIFFPLVMIKDVKLVYRDFRRGGIDFNEFRGVSDYLKQNSQPGDIIMQTDWDDFPMLFYQNTKNYYIVGLDPTFMYNYNSGLYQTFADITMAKIPTGISQLVKENFNAKYFVLDKDRNKLNEYLQADSGFVMVYEDGDAWLYKLK
jgi:hypothetical protein